MKPTPSDLPQLEDESLDVVRLDTVQAERIRWLWPNRFPIGKLSLIAGVQGKGKSFLSLDMAARITAGNPWPDCETWNNHAANVVLLALEDDPADTIRPRFDALGGNASRLLVVRGTRYEDSQKPVQWPVANHRRRDSAPFDLGRDIGRLRALLERNQPAPLVIIDPINGYICGEKDANKDADVRSVLHPLGDLAAEMGAAIVGITHLRKGTDAMDALHRVMGSTAFTAYARAVWFVTVDREDPECRLLLPGKLSVAKPAPSLRFRIASPGVIEWLGEDERRADEALEQPATPSRDGKKLTQAMEFLREALAHGPQRQSELIIEAKAKLDVSEPTMDRAKKRLGVMAKRENDRPGEPSWWSLPDA